MTTLQPWASALAVTLLLMPASALHAYAQEYGEGGYPEGMEGHHPDLLADLDEDIAVVRNKLMGLAEAIPEDAFDWRPAEGIRSVRESLLHVAADNYFIPIALGAPAPAQSGITEAYESARTFEERALAKKSVLQELDASFMHLRRVLDETDPMGLGAEINLFGRPSTVQKTWVMATTHLHEHLGQMIAYARSNGVVPPWSM